MRQPAAGDSGLVYAWGGREPTCHQETALFTIDPGDGSLEPVAPLPEPAGGIMAFDPRDGRLYLLGADEHGTTWLSALDPTTGLVVQMPTNGLGPFAGPPSAMAWAEVCDGFVVATRYGNVLLLDPLTGTFAPAALYVSNEWDEGDWPVGLVLEGGNDSAGDPVLLGGTLRVTSTAGTIDATSPLEAGRRYRGRRGRDEGYRRAGEGPIKSVVLPRGRSLQIVHTGPELVQPLLVDPGEVHIVLRLGEHQWRLTFGGTSVARTPGRLVLRDAPAPGTCAGG